MDVEDAFTTEAIESADTNVDGVLEETIRDIIMRIYSTNELDKPSEDNMNVAVLCFVAGRTYQLNVDEQSPPAMIEIPMTPDEVHEYISYLSRKERHD